MFGFDEMKGPSAAAAGFTLPTQDLPYRAPYGPVVIGYRRPPQPHLELRRDPDRGNRSKPPPWEENMQLEGEMRRVAFMTR